jgi:hypothetical protein
VFEHPEICLTVEGKGFAPISGQPCGVMWNWGAILSTAKGDSSRTCFQIQRAPSAMTQANLFLGNRPSRFDLPERFRRHLIRLDLASAQHLDGPVVRDQGEPEL